MSHESRALALVVGLADKIRQRDYRTPAEPNSFGSFHADIMKTEMRARRLSVEAAAEAVKLGNAALEAIEVADARFKPVRALDGKEIIGIGVEAKTESALLAIAENAFRQAVMPLENRGGISPAVPVSSSVFTGPLLGR